jgi:glycosyltransferase involved in cell wall biosynthesis
MAGGTSSARVRPDRAADGERPLTLVTIGSSTSTHVVSRVTCFAERGHRVIHLGTQVVGMPGVEEVVLFDRNLVDAPPLLRTINAVVERVASRSAGPLNLAYHFFSLLERERADVVHIHYAYGNLAWLAAAVVRCPVVVSVMGGDVLFDEQGSPTPRGKWLTRALLRRADLITTKSHFLTGVLDRLDGLASKATRVVWGVRLSRFRRVDASDLRRRLRVPEGARVVLSPKILQPFYNVHLILEAMPAVLAAEPRACLVITEYLADADYRRRLEERARSLGIAERVVFAGRAAHEEMAAFYSLADVAVGVPESDGLPQTLLEGMACEVPNILARLPRYEEIVRHGESAYFVDTTPAGVAEGVIRLLEDAPLRERIARAGRSIVEREADFDAEVARVEAAYRELVARGARALGLRQRARVLLEICRYALDPTG